MLRIGLGYDIHRLVAGRRLFLGGIKIPYGKGLLGHSDADVLIHAICDALLGAVGAGDIGEHFPDTDAKYKGISSVKLLKEVAGILGKKGFCVGNVDAVVVTEEPRLLRFKDSMRKSISTALKIKKDLVNVKAKTNEGLGEIGRKEAIASYAAVTVIPKRRSR